MKSLSDRLVESSSSVNKALVALENSAKDIFNAYIKVHKPTDTLKDAADYIYKAVIDVITSVGKNDISVDEIKEISNQYYKEITDNLKSEGFKMTDKFDDYLKTLNGITESWFSRKKDNATSDRPKKKKEYAPLEPYEKWGIFGTAIVLALIIGGTMFLHNLSNTPEAIERRHQAVERYYEQHPHEKEWAQKRKEEKKDDFETLSDWQRETNRAVRMHQQNQPKPTYRH